MPFWRRSRGPAGLNKGDARTLAALRDAGADLSKPAHVLVYLYFSAEDQARAAAAEVEEFGYEVTTTPPGGGVAQWSVRGETQLAPSPEAIQQLRADLDGVAAARRGVRRLGVVARGIGLGPAG